MFLPTRLTTLLALLILVVAPTLGEALTQRSANAAAGLAMAPRDGGGGTRSRNGEGNVGGEAVVEKRFFVDLKEFKHLGKLNEEFDEDWVQGDDRTKRRPGWVLYMLPDGWRDNRDLTTAWAGYKGTDEASFSPPAMFTYLHTHGVTFTFRGSGRYLLIISQRRVDANLKPYRLDKDKGIDDEDEIGWEDEKEVSSRPYRMGHLRFDGAIVASASEPTDRRQFRIMVEEREKKVRKKRP